MCFQLCKAILKKREYTGVGAFVEMTHSTDVPKIQERLNEINPYPRPFIESPHLDPGGGTVLYVNAGIIETLEIYAYGEKFPETLEQYTLKKSQISCVIWCQNLTN